jgi:hypothetical protein
MMSSEERPRSSGRSQRRPRRPETPKNNPRLGALLVGAAAFVGLLLFIAGGGGTSAADGNGNGNGGPSATAQNGDEPASDSSTTAPPATTPPSDLEIIAANGAGVSGLAGETGDILAAAGYTNVLAVDGTSTPTTQVYFVEGSEVDAAFITDVLKLSVDRLVPMPDPPPLSNAELGTAKVLVLLGPDFKPDIVRAANATTTTAAPGG